MDDRSGDATAVMIGAAPVNTLALDAIPCATASRGPVPRGPKLPDATQDEHVVVHPAAAAAPWPSSRAISISSSA
jgi:hypothetical protein